MEPDTTFPLCPSSVVDLMRSESVTESQLMIYSNKLESANAKTLTQLMGSEQSIAAGVTISVVSPKPFIPHDKNAE